MMIDNRHLFVLPNLMNPFRDYPGSNAIPMRPVKLANGGNGNGQAQQQQQQQPQLQQQQQRPCR